MKKQILFFAIALFLVSNVFADNAVYLYKNAFFYEQKHVDIMQSLGHTVVKLQDAQIPGSDFSQFDFIVMGQGSFDNAEYIPINNLPALIANSNHLNMFNWSAVAGSRYSDGILRGFVYNDSNFITEGFPEHIDEYTTSKLYDRILPDSRRAYAFDPILTSPNNHDDIVIGTLKPGDVLAIPDTNGQNWQNRTVSNVKSVFFGIDAVDFWSIDSEALFVNSLIWLTTDMEPPEIIDLHVENITNQSANILWSTDKDSTATLLYGLGPLDENLTSTVSLAEDTEFNVFLENLEQLTTYYYKVEVCNKNSFCKFSSVMDFTTLDLTPPYLISTSVTNLTNTEATINFEISEPGNTRIFYGIDELIYTTATSGVETVFSKELSGLLEKTSYKYIIEMCDIYSNCASSSEHYFATLDYTPPNATANLTLEVAVPQNSIKLMWDKPYGEEISEYNIYVSDTEDGFDYNNTYATTSGLMYVDTAASTDSIRYYIVRAVDMSGNEEMNENKVMKYDLSLEVGFNAVSIPLVPFDNSVDAVMHQDSNYNPVMELRYFDATTDQMIGTSFDSISGWDEPTTTMDTAEGFFMLSNSQLKFTLVGYPIQNLNIQIKEGINFVGLSLMDDKNLTDVVMNSPLQYNVTEVASRQSNGQYSLATYYPSVDKWHYTDEFTISAGKGYWIKSKTDFALEVQK
jgi:hypothetical protein